MSRFPILGPAAWLAAIALVGCASTQDAGPPTVIRTAAPQDYEKTINDFFAFKIRGPQDNAVIGVSAPEPGACALGGYSASSRGWVVPAVYETRTREPSGKGAVSVTSKQYYFWFLGNTIAGISPRIEQCPGVEMTFGEAVPPTQQAEGDATRAAASQKQETAKEAKKPGTPPAAKRGPAKKSGSPAAKVNSEATQPTRAP